MRSSRFAVRSLPPLLLLGLLASPACSAPDRVEASDPGTSDVPSPDAGDGDIQESEPAAASHVIDAGDSTLDSFWQPTCPASDAGAPAAACHDTVPDFPVSEVCVGNMRFRVRVAGPKNGETVLFLHGFPEGSYEWRF
jgi:hypothetical protein